MKLAAWSYSALMMFEQCPKKYFHLYVQKDHKDEDSEWSAEGKFIHDAMYKRVVKGEPLPLSLRPMESVAAKFAAAPGEKNGEMKLALDADMQPVDFFSKSARVRVVVDLLITNKNTALIADWKTGKVKPDPIQLGLTAAVLRQWMPEIELFKTVYVWLKHREITPKNYTISKLADVWNEILPRVGKMDEARKTTTFPAKPSGLCRYCPVKTCPHYEER